MMRAFIPQGAVTLAATGARSASAPLTGKGTVAIVFNTAGGAVHVAFGKGYAVANLASMEVPANTARMFVLDDDVDHVAVTLAEDGSGGVHVARGTFTCGAPNDAAENVHIARGAMTDAAAAVAIFH